MAGEDKDPKLKEEPPDWLWIFRPVNPNETRSITLQKHEKRPMTEMQIMVIDFLPASICQSHQMLPEALVSFEQAIRSALPLLPGQELLEARAGGWTPAFAPASETEEL